MIHALAHSAEHKTAANVPDNKAAPEPSAKNAALKAPTAQAAKSSAPSLPPVPRSVSAMIAAAGLPADKLSASIISFARFFSLPLKPELMASIRRQAFAPQFAAVQLAAAEAESAPDAGLGAKVREALSLAATAAESKGVELQPKGLEAFAEAIDPEWQKRQEGGDHQRGRRNKKDERDEEKAPSKTAPVGASAVEEMALDAAGRDPLLAVLNKLPNKNGQRWIVLPFGFSENGHEFKVSLRILLETEQAATRAALMALDVAEYADESSSPARRWLFVLETANSLTVHVQPELPQKVLASLAGELSALLDIPRERVFVKNRTEAFPCESACAQQMPQIDEEA